MRKRYLALAAACAVLFAGSFGYVSAGVGLYQQYRQAYANYQFAATGPCGALIAWSPPRTIYGAFYQNAPSLVTLRYRSSAPQTLRISVSIPRLTQEQSVEAQAVPAFQELTFKPPLLGPGVLDTFVGPDQREAQIRLRVQSGSGTVCDTTVPVVVKSRLWMHWSDPTLGKTAGYLAGWVTPHAPAIVTLVGRAAQQLHDHPELYPGTPALFGYNAGQASPQDVRNQVNAIYDTLETAYQLRYAADNLVYGQDQRIQLPQDILRAPAPTGMCLETTAILASAVEYLGMRPLLVIVPGHAFLGVATGVSPTAPIEYWETSDLNAGADGNSANIHGDDEYRAYALQGRVLVVVDVAYERTQGIEPIE
jgi:hypothetical protein